MINSADIGILNSTDFLILVDVIVIALPLYLYLETNFIMENVTGRS